jgi:hypothetical protein
MSDLTRSLNRTLGRVASVQVVRSDRRRIAVNKAWFARAVHFARLMEQIADIDGDIVECGVADGVSLAMLASLGKASGQARHVWGFDCWTGLPTPSGADQGRDSVAAGGMFSHSSMEKVRDELLAYGLDEAEIAQGVTLVPGFFSETLSQHAGGIALLHVDVDLYQSYLDCLNGLWSHVEIGGVVAFDEYGEPDAWPGARQAVDEFLATHKGEVSGLRQDELSCKWWVTKTA